MKILSLFLFCLLIFVNSGLNYFNALENSTVRSYIVIDGYNEEILEGKNYDETRSVASISKIMTAIIAIESELDLFYSYKIISDWTNIEGSSLYLKEGDEYRLIDLIYGLILRSGNDASYAISEIVCDSVDIFVSKMNEKALSIGMKNTLFSNPCGLDIYDDGNI